MKTLLEEESNETYKIISADVDSAVKCYFLKEDIENFF